MCSGRDWLFWGCDFMMMWVASLIILSRPRVLDLSLWMCSGNPHLYLPLDRP